jgi:maltose alpha-D-glucosyltransferase/alpha-amylase
MSDFILLDFEGEPLKPLAERRKKHSPVKDVVGMLRSYNYAAFASLFRETEGRPGDLDRLLPAARSWSAWTGARFLAAYREQLAGSPLLPANMAELDGLICLYLLDKATYELEYELSQRPDWVRIPLQAIADLAGISVPPAD